MPTQGYEALPTRLVHLRKSQDISVRLDPLRAGVIAQTEFSCVEEAARDPELAQQLGVEVLPASSTANMCAMLKAVLPLPPLSAAEAHEHVVKHLVNRPR